MSARLNAHLDAHERDTLLRRIEREQAEFARVGLRDADKQLEGAGSAQLLEVDLRGEQVAQWVEVEGVELRR